MSLAAPLPSAFLRIEQLRVSFAAGAGRQLRALDDISLTVARGQTVAVVGESGCGKSTLARAAIRALTPEFGRILIDGEEITGLAQRELRHARQKLQIVFQDPYSSLDPRWTVGRIVAEPLRFNTSLTRAEIGQRVGELLAAVGLPADAADRTPVQFSGGQRQRIALARALAPQPMGIIADEPTSALDVVTQAQIVVLLRELRDRLGLTLLLISHDLALVYQIADRVAVMYLGRIVEEGTAAEVIGRPLHPYTVALISATPTTDAADAGRRIILGGEPPSPVDRPAGCAFHARCPIARPRCHHDDPALTGDVAGRRVACWHPGEMAPPFTVGTA